MYHKDPITICVAAGQSGGHLLPALALARQVRYRDPDTQTVLFSTATSLDKKILEGSGGIDKHFIFSLARLSSRQWYAYPRAAWSVGKAFLYSLIKLKTCRARHIVSTGGLIAIPVCLAGWLLGIPITLYELNAVPGKAIAFLARFATRVCICFEGARPAFTSIKKEKIVKVDYPLRFSEADKISQVDARTRLGVARDAKVLLILGGSQGSNYLNTCAQAYLRYRMLMLPETLQPLVVFHQAGESEKEAVENFYKNYGIVASVFSYKSDIALYYAAADIVVARAGAGTVSELAFFEKKAVLIPLEVAAAGHQVHNAYAIAAQYPDLFSVYRQSDIDQNSSELYNYLDSFLA